MRTRRMLQKVRKETLYKSAQEYAAKHRMALQALIHVLSVTGPVTVPASLLASLDASTRVVIDTSDAGTVFRVEVPLAAVSAEGASASTPSSDAPLEDAVHEVVNTPENVNVEVPVNG